MAQSPARSTRASSALRRSLHKRAALWMRRLQRWARGTPRQPAAWTLPTSHPCGRRAVQQQRPRGAPAAARMSLRVAARRRMPCALGATARQHPAAPLGLPLRMTRTMRRRSRRSSRWVATAGDRRRRRCTAPAPRTPRRWPRSSGCSSLHSGRCAAARCSLGAMKMSWRLHSWCALVVEDWLHHCQTCLIAKRRAVSAFASLCCWNGCSMAQVTCFCPPALRAHILGRPTVQVHSTLPQSPACQPVKMDVDMLLPIPKLRDLSSASEDGSGSPTHVSWGGSTAALVSCVAIAGHGVVVCWPGSTPADAPSRILRHPCLPISPSGCRVCSICLQRLRTTYSLDSPAVQAATHAAVTAAMEASNGVAAMAAMGAAPGSSRRPARAAAAGAAAAARAAAEAAGTPVARRASGGLGRTSSSGGAPLSLLPMSPEDDGAVVTPGVAPQVMFGGCVTATLLLAIGCTPAVCRAPPCLAPCSLHVLLACVIAHLQAWHLSAHACSPKKCNCKKSKCLKLYCDCFANGGYCGPACSCMNCANKVENRCGAGLVCWWCSNYVFLFV